MRVLIVVHAILAVAALFWMVSASLRRRREAKKSAQILRLHAHAEAPPTLHPVIDPNVCIGSAACVRACPEEKALVVVDGRAHLAQASGCVGHGACKSACPVDAISLVFGTAHRGVELPELDEYFQTSQRGLYIAGELGGMGLIATAVRQGVKAVGAIAASLAAEGARAPEVLPLLVIGAGPAGIAASLEAHRLGLRVRLVDKEDSIGGSVRRYPRGKVVMTTPADLPLYGRVHLRRTSKAALIELWEDVFARATVDAEFGVEVASIQREGDVLVASTSAGVIAARRILLATGRRGKPRRLDVPGEELAHVHHGLEDPEAHDGQACLVVGGGDVALEAALALAERPGTRVTLCHRSARFDRAKPENQERLAAAEARGLRVLRAAHVERFDAASATILTPGGREQVEAASAFVLVGTELPANLLGSSGVDVRTYRGDPVAAH